MNNLQETRFKASNVRKPSVLCIIIFQCIIVFGSARLFKCSALYAFLNWHVILETTRDEKFRKQFDKIMRSSNDKRQIFQHLSLVIIFKFSDVSDGGNLNWISSHPHFLKPVVYNDHPDD